MRVGFHTGRFRNTCEIKLGSNPGAARSGPELITDKIITGRRVDAIDNATGDRIATRQSDVAF
jgi:hypothetical protein